MIEIRDMRIEEIEAVCRVDREAFRSSRFGELTGLAGQQAEALGQWQSVKDFRAYCARHPGRVIVASDGSEIGGFAIWDYDEAVRLGRVYSCALLPAFRGKGLAVTLLRRLLDMVRERGAKRITASTTHEPRACRMYEKVGLRLAARRHKTTPNGTPYDCSDYELVFESISGAAMVVAGAKGRSE